MNPLPTILAVGVLLSSCSPTEQSDGKKQNGKIFGGNVESPIPSSSPAEDNGTPTSARTFSPALAEYVRNLRAPEPAADWRTALSNPSVDAGIKEATVKKLGQEKNTEAVPLLVHYLMEIGPGFRASAQTWRPCRNALIQIGEPAVTAVSERFLVAETFQERFELFYILQTISGGEWALEWLEAVRDHTPLVSDEEFTRYRTFAHETAASQKGDPRWIPKDVPQTSETR